MKRTTTTLVAHLFDKGFFLGGSRRMAAKYPNEVKVDAATDWDFYGHYTSTAVDQLVELGFTAKDPTEYYDDELIQMFVSEDRAIQVLLRKDVYLYRQVFESIPVELYVRSLWKSSPLRPRTETAKDFNDRVSGWFNAKFKEIRTKQEAEALF
jgi:hypothetical protein